MDPQSDSAERTVQKRTEAEAWAVVRAEALEQVLSQVQERVEVVRAQTVGWGPQVLAQDRSGVLALALARLGVRVCVQALVQAQVEVRERVQALVQARVQALMQAQVQAQAQARARARARAQVQTQAQAEALAQVWARVWAEVWAQARVHVGAPAQVQREVQARVQVQIQTEAHSVTYGEVLADSGLMGIFNSLEPDYRQRLARDLWPRRHKYWWFIQIIAPITRLPPELLQEILFIIIDQASHSPLPLIRVSKLWRTIVTGIWASLKLGTTTPKDAVTRKLERNQWLLDVLVDTEIDRGHFTPSEDTYRAIFAAIEATPRWRTFVVETFPAQTDLPDRLVNRALQQCSDLVLNRLRTFKIKRPCEMSPLLEYLLRILGNTASEELTTVEINSPSVISFLALTYPSIFHSVTVLCLDTPGLPNPVDLLPHLHRLEELTASHLTFPIYHNDVNIPFVHTLRHLTLRAVSIQWMSGRSFHVLESCTLLLPRRHQVLHTFSTTLPICQYLTFQGYPLDVLHGVSAHNLTRLSVVSSCSYELRGSRQLVRFSSQALRESRLVPRILHIGIDAMSWAWTKAFGFMSNLEELVIENAHPSSLGVKALESLVVHPVHANDPGTTATDGGRNTPVCPSLKRLGIRYRRWLRPSEHFDLIPVFISIIWSRQQSECSLQSFRVWKGSEQKDPLELLEGSWIGLTAFKPPAKDDAFKREDLLKLVAIRSLESLFRP